MAYVTVPKDLSKVKSKVAFNLTKRQIICFGLAIAIGVPFYLLTKDALTTSVSGICMVLFMLPFFFLAMFEKDGLPFEKILSNYIRFLMTPQIRTYKTTNLYRQLSELPDTNHKEVRTVERKKRRKNRRKK